MNTVITPDAVGPTGRRGGLDHLRSMAVLLAIAIAVAVAVTVVTLFLVPQLVGHQLAVVRSDSTAPVLRTGDLIVSTGVAVEDVRAEDVITFRDEARDVDVTHRVVSNTPASPDEFVLTTRGAGDPDATRWRMSSGREVARLTATVPRVGTLTGVLDATPVKVAGLLAAVLLAAVVAARRGRLPSG